MRFEIALMEWSDDPGLAGPRLVARVADRDLVDAVRERVARRRRRELSALDPVDRGKDEATDAD